ncbi:hypothetical protein [Cupriavidus sp. H19C3]|uniref:hypothetical protein n=1 Tax=Cupriavidus sp. H19C3 TaxID=3241603 RepID=UPI003BF8A01E
MRTSCGRGTQRLASGKSTTAGAAALINGAAAHAAEIDDSFKEAMYRPGASTIAAGQDVGATGETVL